LQDRIRVVPNAVTPVDPHLLATAQRGPVVLAVGRLAAVKRHGLLIEAWRRIVERFPEWELRIFGEGPLRETLETQVAEAGLEGSVRLMGHTSDIAQEYLAASILAHPAEFEGFPLAVTEALAAGLPVVGFDDCSGLNRLVADGVNGQLVPAAGLGPEKRTQAFADALAALMADTEARRALSAGAPGSVAQYAPDLVVDMWEDMIFGPKGGTAKEDDVHG
jgi:glycosyltransferase involved in cell wall biosynthesis